MKGDFGVQLGSTVNDTRHENVGYDSVDCGHLSIESSISGNSIIGGSHRPEEINSKSEVLPIELIQLLENSRNWNRKESCNKKKMERRKEELAKHLYAKVHQVPRLYRNLYYYFFVRCDSSKSLYQYTSKFREWELEFHNEEANERRALPRNGATSA